MRITTFNRAAEEITGYTREEAVGMPCRTIFRSSVCASECPVREAMVAGGPVVNREFDIKTRDNRTIPVSISASILRDQDGTVQGGVEVVRDLSLIASLKREIEEKFTFQDLVGRAPNMRHLFDVIPDVAASDATVLLHGESGTGKELFARAIHQMSPRAKGPLVVVNCGALPEQLLEAEIFGARKGAYTGAVEDRPGRLEMAQGGTLFLDEIGDLPLPLQVKLLRVLENREYQPLGAKQPRTADVRFITATHRDMEQMVEEGSFRRDLFFRINVVSLTIPPLRERREDIPLLIDMHLEKLNLRYSKHIRSISPDVMKLLLQYDFPGNVRELLNLLEQMVILCRGSELGLEHLPDSFRHIEAPSEEGRKPRRRLSRARVVSALERHGGNRTRAAEELGVDRTTLWRWMKRMHLA
ncbi:MAG: PAS domain-containing protein [Deltaproteobacteria bacterium]|nr:MAG: PAS domain-containing protein [Deltaproteobacteria bacterium]